MLDKPRRFDVAISKNASLVILDRMIQGMTVSEKLEFCKRTIYEAQTVPHREMVLRKVKGFWQAATKLGIAGNDKSRLSNLSSQKNRAI